MSEDAHWCSEPDLIHLKDFIMTACVSLLAHAQSIEPVVKDLTLYKMSNRDELTTSFMTSIRSYFAPTTKQSMIEDETFINRKRTNEDARDFFDAKVFNTNLLMQVSSAFPRGMPKEEHDYCYVMLVRSKHVKAIRATKMVDEVMAAAPKPDNAHVKKHGV